MTDKELHKLGRRELLQLLLQQGREAEEQRLQLVETEEQLRQLEENYERLRKRLDQKDEQIHQLRDTLEAERTKREIKLEEAGSIAEAALRLNGIFEAAQSAADQYLHNVRLLGGPENGESPGRPDILDIQAEIVPAGEPVDAFSRAAAEPGAVAAAAGVPSGVDAVAGRPPMAETAGEIPAILETGEPLLDVEASGKALQDMEAPAKPLLATEMYRIKKKEPEEISEPAEKAMILKRQQGWRTISQPAGRTTEPENGMFHKQSGLRRASS